MSTGISAACFFMFHFYDPHRYVELLLLTLNACPCQMIKREWPLNALFSPRIVFK